MSVRDELSSDVAAALIGMSGQISAGDLREVLALFRSTLGTLTDDERRRRQTKLFPERSPDRITGTAQGMN
ncbi:MAG TPA: hypothetical protein VIP46_02060 [Pyrinomonadaceae bacterium]